MSWIEIARTVEEVQALRPVWDLLQTPFVTSDLEFLLAYVKNTAGVIRPHAVVLRDDSGPVALVSGRVEDVRLPARLGPKTVLNPEVRSLTITYGGFMGRVDDATVPRLLAAVKESVEPGEVDVIRLRMLTVGSPVHTVAMRSSPFLRRERFSTQMPHWQAEIPGSLDEFLARRSRRRRESVRRYSKRLEKTYGDEARVEVFRSRDQIDRLFADSALVHRETYQAVLGVGFSDARVQRALTELAMDRGWFRGYVLYLKGSPAAFWHGNAYKGVFGIGATGFDPAFADARPGTYLLMRVIEDLAADDAVHTLDFGFGDAEYKRHFGDERRIEQDVVLVEPRARPIALNLARTAVLGASSVARGAAERAGALGELRRRRRERLAEQAKHGGRRRATAAERGPSAAARPRRARRPRLPDPARARGERGARPAGPGRERDFDRRRAEAGRLGGAHRLPRLRGVEPGRHRRRRRGPRRVGPRPGGRAAGPRPRVAGRGGPDRAGRAQAPLAGPARPPRACGTGSTSSSSSRWERPRARSSSYSGSRGSSRRSRTRPPRARGSSCKPRPSPRASLRGSRSARAPAGRSR